MTIPPDAPTRSRPPKGRLLLGVATAGLLVLGAAACSKSSADSASSGDVASLSGDATATTAPADQKSTEEKVLAFAKCMREHGVPSFPDPKVDAQGRIDAGGFRDNAQSAGFDPQSQSFRDAMTACRSDLQGVNFGRGNVDPSKLRDAAVQYAQCMRTQGLANVTDPTFPQGGFGGGGGGQGNGGNGGNGGQGTSGGQGQGGTGGQGGQGGVTGGQGGQGGQGQGGRGGNRLLQSMGLDPNDPAVQAADKACRPAFQQAIGQAGPQQ